jgi:rieske iron-sulfur protein
MKSNFSEDRRDMLKSTCTLVGATALVSVGGCLQAFASSGASKGDPKVGDTFIFTNGPNKDKDVMVTDVVVDALPITVMAKNPATGKARENDGDTDHATTLLYRVAPDKIPADMKDDTDEGVMAYSAICTHLGCMLSNWDALTKAFMCPCHDATFDPLKDGENTGGATSRALPHFPVKAVGGKLVVSGVPSGYVGVKRTT